MTDPIILRQRCRMNEVVLGLLIHAGTEFQTEVCLLPGETINLTADEMSLLDGRWYEKAKMIGISLHPELITENTAIVVRPFDL